MRARPVVKRGSVAQVAAADRVEHPQRDLVGRAGQHDVAVAAPVDVARRREAQPRSDPPVRLAGAVVDGRPRPDHVHQRLQQADVDHLAVAGQVAMAERRQHGERAAHAGHLVGQGDRRQGGRPVRLAGGVRQRGHALGHGAEPGAVGVGAGLPVAGHPQHHQAGVLRQQHRLGVEAQPLQRPGPEVLDQHVGAAHQSQQHLAAVRRLQIDLDRPLVPAHLAPVEAVFSVALAQVAGAVTGVRPLHLDHVRAEVGQVPARGGAGEDGGQVEDDQTGQRTMAGCAHAGHVRARDSTNP